MRRSGAVVAVVALVVTLTAGAAGGAPPGPRPDGPTGPCRSAGAMAVASEAEYLAEMIPHHEEAVTAARELARSDRPEMRELGESIVATQTAEIDQMRAWLDLWYPDVEPIAGRPMMRDLSGLEGDALDRAFLEDMVMHHMMAVMMSRQLVLRDLAVHDAVAEFADGVREAQRAEIVTMRTWLAEWFGARRLDMGPGTGMGMGMHLGMHRADGQGMGRGGMMTGRP